MVNPFGYRCYPNLRRFSAGDQFSDRRAIREDILSRLFNGEKLDVVLYGPRRYGKSALVAELVDDLSKAGIPCVAIDVAKTPSIDLFVSSYATKVHECIGIPLRYELKTFLRNPWPKIIHEHGSARLAYKPFNKPISAKMLVNVLNLPQKMAIPYWDRAVIIFDEFQEVKDLLPHDGFEQAMKSSIRWQRNVSHIFLGSQYRILEMFTDPNRPLYKSAVPILLDKPPVDESIRFVIDRFASAGKTIPREVAERLVAEVENIPYFIQQLGFETFRLIGRRKSVWEEDIFYASFNLVQFNSAHYEQLMLTLPRSQRMLLFALARERTSELGEAYCNRYALGDSSTVNSASAKLLESGLIERSDGRYGVSDPIFAQFLRQEDNHQILSLPLFLREKLS